VILFLFIAILEDCGYLARAAYMMDRLMRGVGLSGRAFIPLLSSFACAIPAIMGTRTIADRRERFITIMIAPFMSCSARLPVYVIMIAAFVPATSYLGGWLGLQPLVMMGMYLVGVAAAILVAYAMRKTVLPGAGSNFMMELPAYKIPGVRVVAHRVWEAAREFLIRAGTLILLVNVIVWALAYFPRSEATRTAVETIAAEQGWDQERTANELEGRISARQLSRSGRPGDRTGAASLGMGLANWRGRDRLIPGPRSDRGHDGHLVQSWRPAGRSFGILAAGIADRNVARWQAAVHLAGRDFDHGLLCPVRTVRSNSCRDLQRDKKLDLSCGIILFDDRDGLCWSLVGDRRQSRILISRIFERSRHVLAAIET
jgi:hypothetical protein